MQLCWLYRNKKAHTSQDDDQFGNLASDYTGPDLTDPKVIQQEGKEEWARKRAKRGYDLLTNKCEVEYKAFVDIKLTDKTGSPGGASGGGEK